MTDSATPTPDEPGRISRRRFAKIAAGTFVGAIGFFARSGAVGAATKVAAVTVACCHLAKPNDSGCIAKCNSLASYTNYRLKSWRCTFTRTVTYSCYECTTGSTCRSGTYYCSQAVREN